MKVRLLRPALSDLIEGRISMTSSRKSWESIFLEIFLRKSIGWSVTLEFIASNLNFIVWCSGGFLTRFIIESFKTKLWSFVCSTVDAIPGRSGRHLDRYDILAYEPFPKDLILVGASLGMQSGRTQDVSHALIPISPGWMKPIWVRKCQA